MPLPKQWGKLFHSLMILTKKEYWKAFTFADLMDCIVSMICWILYSCYGTQNSHGILAHLTQTLSYNTPLKRAPAQWFASLFKWHLMSFLPKGNSGCSTLYAFNGQFAYSNRGLTGDLKSTEISLSVLAANCMLQQTQHFVCFVYWSVHVIWPGEISWWR